MLKKSVLIIIINSLIFSPLVLFPETAQAQYLTKVITDEAANLGIFVTVTQTAATAADAQRAVTVPIFDVVGYSQLRAVESAKATKETKSNIIQALFMMLFEALRRRLLDMLVDQIIVWIQGGGKPQFVSDWQGFVRNAAQAAIGDVVLETDAAFICSPFRLLLRLTLLPVPKFSQRVRCTLDSIVTNINDFYKDFRKGGWLAYNEAWQPQNNYYGQVLVIHDEMGYRAAARKQAVQNEALAGKGFLSQKRCKGGGMTPEPGIPPPPNYVKDYKGNYCDVKDIENITPGTIVGEMTAKAVGIDIDYLLSAKELEQYVAAIVNAVINRTIKEGLAYIGPSPPPPPPPSQTYEDAVTAIQTQEKARIIAEYQKVIDDRQAVLANKIQAASSTQQIVVVLQQIKAANCEPPVSDAEISSAEAEVNRLNTEIANLQELIADIQALKDAADLLSPDYRLRGTADMTILTQKYNEFTTNYSSIIAEVYSGSAKSASQAEAQNKQTELSNAQNRLNTCVTTPTPPTP